MKKKILPSTGICRFFIVFWMRENSFHRSIRARRKKLFQRGILSLFNSNKIIFPSHLIFVLFVLWKKRILINGMLGIGIRVMVTKSPALFTRSRIAYFLFFKSRGILPVPEQHRRKHHFRLRWLRPQQNEVDRFLSWTSIRYNVKIHCYHVDRTRPVYTQQFWHL